jgi:hypothetical protein
VGSFKSRRGYARDHAFGDRLSALLIACRRRKGGGTNNLRAHRFQRVMAESSHGNSCNVASLLMVVLKFIYKRDYVLRLLCLARGGLKMSCLAGKSHYHRQNKQQMDFQVAHTALFFSLFSSCLLFLPALVLRKYTRTHNSFSPFACTQSDEISQARAHTHLQYNPLVSCADVLGALC